MRRNRPVGIGALQKDKQKQELFQQKGAVIAQEELSKLTSQMDEFKSNLEKFASKYKNDIRKNAEFRRHFQQMCAVAGVDPLRSSASFWGKLLGVGDFYYELAIQIVEVFLTTDRLYGGVMSIEELQKRLLLSRGGDPITRDDILEAIKKLKVLGSNIREAQTNNSYVIHSTPAELNSDHIEITRLAHSSQGRVTHDLLKDKLSWSDERVSKALSELIMEGMVWVDDQTDDRLYFFPGMKE